MDDIDLKRYEGHTPGPMHVSLSTIGVPRVKAGRKLIARFERRVDADLFADIPELLAEVVRLRADLAEAVQTLDAIERAIGMRFAPAEILDENSPIREGMRAVLAKHGGA